MKTFALVGLGSWGLRYLETVKEINNCRIKYVCSPNINQKEINKKQYVAVKDYKKLLTIKGINGVIIATPLNTHYKIAHDFLSKGFNVLLEKPIALSLQDAQKLHELAKTNNCLLLTDYSYLYNSAFRVVKSNLKKIGKIIFLEFEMGNPDSSENNSALWQWGPHVLSMTYFLLHKILPEIDSAEVEKDELDSKNNIDFNIRLKEDIKIFGKIGYNLNSRKRTLKILGSKGYIYFNEQREKKVLISLSNGKKLIPKYKKTSSLENLVLYFCERSDNKLKRNNKELDVFVTGVLEKLERNLERS